MKRFGKWWDLIGMALGFTAIGFLLGVDAAYEPRPACEAKTVLTIPYEGYSVAVPKHLTRSQSELLDIAYRTAKSDGHRHPELLQGILLQETLAGALASYKVAGQEAGLRVNQRYYGVMQIKLSAARDVLKKYPDLWDQFEFQTRTDEEVIAQLIENDVFNIAVASKYCLILQQSGYRTAGAIAVAYNKGPAGAAGVNVMSDPYAMGVSRHLQELAEPEIVFVKMQ